MRVIAGKFRSRPLASFHGMDIRPTSDRLRETLFNILTAGNTEALAGTTWLDLYAGTGALGIEAISRGAAMVYFVESSSKAAEVISKNLVSLKIEKGFQILKIDALRAFPSLAKNKTALDFAFIDPPYRLQAAYGEALHGLAESEILKPEGIAIVEHEKRFDPGEQIDRFERFRKVEQGDATLSFYRISHKS